MYYYKCIIVNATSNGKLGKLLVIIKICNITIYMCIIYNIFNLLHNYKSVAKFRKYNYYHN